MARVFVNYETILADGALVFRIVTIQIGLINWRIVTKSDWFLSPLCMKMADISEGIEKVDADWLKIWIDSVKKEITKCESGLLFLFLYCVWFKDHKTTLIRGISKDIFFFLMAQLPRQIAWLFTT